MSTRTAQVNRETRETQITVEIDLDGEGRSEIDTPLPFFNHMLEAFAKHGLYTLKVHARGDIEVWRWFERFQGWRTHRLDGQQVRGGLAALGRRQRVFGCGEVCCRLYCRRRCS